MKSALKPLLAVALVAIAPNLAAYESEAYTSSKCGIKMAIPAGTRGQVTEAIGADGLCRVDLAVEGVEFHGVTTKDPKVTLAEAQGWTVTDSGIASSQWQQFDEGANHVGYRARVAGKNVWGAAARGTTHSCAAFVRASTSEPESDLEQFYQSLECP